MTHQPDDILNLQEVAAYLRLDPRTVLRIASALGGRRTGRRWRFRYADVTRYFNADITQEQRQRVDGEGYCGRQTSRLQNVPARKERRPGMEVRKGMGGGRDKKCAESDGVDTDPYGLRKALGLG